jgi:putative ABC transport system permease protein
MLAPSLLVFALALLALRIIPRLLIVLARLLELLPGVSTLLALRYLARTTKAYSGSILLITLTLSLAAFTASMARTLDDHSAARAHYSAGADIRLVYQNAGTVGAFDSGSTGGASAGSVSPGSLDYLFVPVDDYLKIPGVAAVTRVAPSQGFISAAGAGKESGTFLGIDRATLASVLSDAWRSDYASESLGSLLNRLASDPESAIVSAKYAADHGLQVGDKITVSLNDLGETHDIPFVIAGTVNYFPTLYLEQGPYVIGNLDYSFEQQGSAYPYEIWIHTTPGTTTDAVAGQAFGNGLEIRSDTPETLLQVDFLRPERQGLFGLLSVGFMAAALVTIIGFLAQTLLSFQRRIIELGMLRAIGLSTRQLAALLILEQTLVIGAGTLVGTGLGVLVSRLFVPFLQVRAEDFPDTPPFRVQLAWNQIALVYIIAGGLLILTVLLTLARLRRLRLFEAVKLGDAV